jgi:uncharacterized protein YbjT (DUF2867 family)
MTSPILVTGGTGTLGREVVPRLRNTGRDVRVLSRHSRADEDGIRYLTGDLATGEGVESAVDGVETIVHVAGTNRGDEVKAANLVRAAARAGARHLVFISVVGADRIPVTSRIDRAMFGYFASKRATEQVIAGSGMGWTTLRATQFHDLVLLTVRQLARLPVVPVPAGWRFQPVDAGEVAARLVELALGAPAGLVTDLGGPRIYELAELVRSYLRATYRHRPILPVRTPGGPPGRSGLRQPGPRPGGGPPDLGGVPRRAGEPRHQVQWWSCQPVRGDVAIGEARCQPAPDRLVPFHAVPPGTAAPLVH